MNKFIKAALVVLVLTAMPLKQWAQTPYRQYADEGILLDFFEIGNPDFRLFLLYNLDQDDRFVVTPDEQFGLFTLVPNSDRHDDSFLDTFEDFYNSIFADFRLIDKVDLEGLVIRWKSSVPPTHFASITMDLAFNRATTVNNTCVNSDPFCTSDVIQFQAAETSQTADDLEDADFDDGCIGSSYNPSWYHMRINTPGQFIIHMEGHDPNTNQERDIDFCMWGPFDDPTAPCVSQLTTDKIIDCNYSAHYSEDIFLGFPENEHEHQASHGTVNYHMPETGEYYIAMICNFSREPCVITFTKTEDSGPGTTDCGILPGIANNSGPYCVGETIRLTVTTQAGASYSWTGPNGFSSNEQNPSIPNCTYEMGGTYTCVTAVDGQTTSGSTTVVVFAEPVADFSFNTVCEGNVTQLTSTAVTAPAGHEIENYQWDFGDGYTSDEPNVNHTYATAGEYQVTLSVQTGRGRCTDEITKTVTVYAQPIADAGEDQTIGYGQSTQLNGDGGGSGFIYHWEPADMVTNPNAQNTQTVVLTNHQTYTLTVTNPQGQCIDSAQVTVYIDGGPLAVTASAEPNSLCEGESTQLTATALYGTHNYTYSWTPTTGLNNPNIANPIATPSQTTTYTCHVSDGQTEQTISTMVTVFHDHLNGVATINENYPYFQCDSIPFVWFGDTTYFKEKGTYTFSSETNPYAQTIQGCDTAMRVTVTKMMYSPQPAKIECKDEAIVWGAPYADADTVAVVTNTEFFSFQYTFKVTESGHNESECNWDICKWEISKTSWTINITPDPFLTPDGYYSSECTVIVADRDDDYVVLTATIGNDCNSVQRKIYLKSSFLDVDENESAAAKVNIVPNPNNGQMRIDFEDIDGLTYVKVFDMTGNPIDAFETNIGTSRYSYDYTMKQHAEGIYFFVFNNNKRLFTKKVVIIQ
jgi:PKD repeat protein